METPEFSVPGPNGEALHPDTPPAWFNSLAPAQLFAWAWKNVNLAFTAQAAELKESGLRLPFRGLMLFAWAWGVQHRDMHSNHLNTLLRDTGRLGTSSHVSDSLREAILALHYLGRVGIVVQRIAGGNGTPAEWAHFNENLLLSLQRAVLANPDVASDAAERLGELYEA